MALPVRSLWKAPRAVRGGGRSNLCSPAAANRMGRGEGPLAGGYPCPVLLVQPRQRGARAITSRHDQPLLRPPLVLQPGDGQPSHSRSAQPPAGTGATRAARAALLRWAPGAGWAPARGARPSRPTGVQAGIPRRGQGSRGWPELRRPPLWSRLRRGQQTRAWQPPPGQCPAPVPAPNRLDLTKTATHRRTKLLKVPLQGRSTATPAQRLSSAPGENLPALADPACTLLGSVLMQIPLRRRGRL